MSVADSATTGRETAGMLDPKQPSLRRSVLLLAALLFAACTHQEESDDMADDDRVHHGINYIEFAVSDMAEAKDFYSTAFGWSFNDYGPDYAGIRKGEGEAGGFRFEEEVAPGGPLVVLYSGDLEASAAGVVKAGGRITKEAFEFPGGRRFEFTDPSGNQLAVWSEQ